jgi:hypothetical protein
MALTFQVEEIQALPMLRYVVGATPSIRWPQNGVASKDRVMTSRE